MQLNKFASIPHPAADYAADYLEATRRIAAWPGNGTSNIIDPCQVQFLTHQDKAERAIVLFHGYTACPDQFYRLGTTFHNLGYNVLIPRMRYHGRRDRLTSSQARLTAATLVAVANDAVDIAHGLGRQVQVMGLSMGGVMAAWVAQNRADVERVMIISPALGLYAIPFSLTRPAMWLALILPNIFRWWDPEHQTDIPYPPYNYPRYSTRTLGQILHLGFAIRDQARSRQPLARSIIVVTNAGDQAVDNRAAAELVQRWRQSGAPNLRTCQFTAKQNLLHDLIDPNQIGERTDLVYPVLVDLMTRDSNGKYTEIQKKAN